MHPTHARYLLTLPRRQGLLTALFLLLAVSLSAQIRNHRNSYNYLDFADNPYYFGITLGGNSSDYDLEYSSDFALNDSIAVATSSRGPGLNLGIVTNLKLGQYFDLRLLPTLTFVERRLQFTNPNTLEAEQQSIEATFVELPFHVRYKSSPYKDMRMFVVAGVKYGFDVASNSRNRQEPGLVRVSPTDFSIEYGVGVQFFFPFFIFSPEFKVSHGLNNVLIYDEDNPQSSVLDRVLSRSFTLAFHFEG